MRQVGQVPGTNWWLLQGLVQLRSHVHGLSQVVSRFESPTLGLTRCMSGVKDHLILDPSTPWVCIGVGSGVSTTLYIIIHNHTYLSIYLSIYTCVCAIHIIHGPAPKTGAAPDGIGFQIQLTKFQVGAQVLDAPDEVPGMSLGSRSTGPPVLRCTEVHKSHQ